MALFNRGYGEAEKKAKEIEDRQSNNVFRFWMPQDHTTTIIFLDDEPPVYDEHQLQIGGSWKNWFTCKKQFGERCSICEDNKVYPYTAGAYTIIDRSEWTDKKGTVHKDERKLFIAKLDTLKKLKKMSAKRGGLRGCIFEVTRSTSQNSPSTGDMFEFEGKLSEEELEKMFAGKEGDGHKPYDYDKILAPKDDDEISDKMDKEAEDNYDEEDDDVNF
jgi:hypothetical protein